jgi:hypothetical protein
MISFIVILALSYLVGSIPTSILAARWLRGIDIRQHGSGNAGATNVFRVLGKGPGISVMLIDLLKGVFAVGVIARLRIAGGEPPEFMYPNGDGWLMVAAGAAAVLGHIYTVYAGFKGGKGVATGAGAGPRRRGPLRHHRVDDALRVARLDGGGGLAPAHATHARVGLRRRGLRPDNVVLRHRPVPDLLHAPRQHRPAAARDREPHRPENGLNQTTPLHSTVLVASRQRGRFLF